MNLMLNLWLLYQVLLAGMGPQRFTNRAGVRFRDQLQDVMALNSAPKRPVRILRRRPALRRAMCSTGGIRRLESVCTNHR